MYIYMISISTYIVRINLRYLGKYDMIYHDILICNAITNYYFIIILISGRYL